MRVPLDSVLPLLLLPLIWNLLWIVIGDAALWPEFFVTSTRLIQLSEDAKFVAAYVDSLVIIAGSFVLAITSSLVLALITMKVPGSRKLIEYMSSGIGPVPTMAWLPIFLILLGFNQSTIYAMCVWSVVWLATPQIIGLFDIAVKNWQPQVANLGFGSIQAMKHVYVPAVLPGLMAISKTYVMQIWRVIFAIEVIFGSLGGHMGLGMMMFDYKGKFDHLETYASLLLIILTGMIINWLFSLCKRLTQW